MGQAGAALGNVFNANRDQVPGTGMSVGDLKSGGYSPQEIQSIGGGQPSSGVSFARQAIQGGLQGLGKGLQGMGRPYGGGGMGGGGVAPVNQTPTIQPQIYQPQGPGTGMMGGMPRRRMDTLNFYGEARGDQ